ncbi:glycosyltransferase family 25 protein [Achromobacter marplatensis]|uniref:glycosyltransferase family 25 protein n=1 Tax=Achromobacter marplatensis TaxID=470868 RepID=UPI003D04F7F4
MISLPDCADRRRRISGCLDGLGLSFDFVDAVDGRNGIPDEFESMIDREGGAAVIPFSEPPRIRPLTDSEFGCALSHILV